MNRIAKDIIPISKTSFEWRKVLPAVVASKKKSFLNDKMISINPFYYEIFEQYLITKWIKPNDKVLELGGRLGVVSFTIQSILHKKENHVVVEPNEKPSDAK